MSQRDLDSRVGEGKVKDDEPPTQDSSMTRGKFLELTTGAAVFTAGMLTGTLMSFTGPNDVTDFFAELFSTRVNNPIVYPTKTSPRIASDYRSPVHYDGDLGLWVSHHDGVDILEKIGYPVIASAGGKVIVAGYHPKRGHRVVMYHGQDIGGRHIYSGYFSMSPELNVAPNLSVNRGAKLGTLGNSGNSRKPHLHFMVWTSPTDKYVVLPEGVDFLESMMTDVNPHDFWIRDHPTIANKDPAKVNIPPFVKDAKYSSLPIRFTYPVPV